MVTQPVKGLVKSLVADEKRGLLSRATCQVPLSLDREFENVTETLQPSTPPISGCTCHRTTVRGVRSSLGPNRPRPAELPPPINFASINFSSFNITTSDFTTKTFRKHFVFSVLHAWQLTQSGKVVRALLSTVTQIVAAFGNSESEATFLRYLRATQKSKESIISP